MLAFDLSAHDCIKLHCAAHPQPQDHIMKVRDHLGPRLQRSPDRNALLAWQHVQPIRFSLSRHPRYTHLRHHRYPLHHSKSYMCFSRRTE